MKSQYKLVFLTIALAPGVLGFTVVTPTAFRTAITSKRKGCLVVASSSGSGGDTRNSIAVAQTQDETDQNDESTTGHSLIDWASQHGAFISESIGIRSTEYGGRGLFALEDISANTELIMLPGHLQLGVGQLAEGDDVEMQSFARELPWRDVLDQGLAFLPLSVALLSEMRKGAASVFAPYLGEIPTEYTNAVAPTSDTGFGMDDDLFGLETWAPITAQKVTSRRQAMISLHERLAPPSLALRDLCWAAATVCSRSLVRQRVRELTPFQAQQIGDFCASDHSRLLPVIDLVNHGGRGANAKVSHLGGDNNSPSDEKTQDPFSTSLISTREITAGAEVLLDYGAGNERLLLDYGFVLPHQSGDTVTLRLEDFLPAISALAVDRAGMSDVSEDDAKELTGIVYSLINLSSSQKGAPLIFDANGTPSLLTVCLALAMTCRGPSDVERLLIPVRASLDTGSNEQLLTQIVESSTEEQAEFAVTALKKAATMALAQKTPAEPTADDGGGGFADVAREYSDLCREMVQRVAE
jgi:hypothetical protein